MVGVAGKSKGCHTCRKRKIKCDLLKPKCNQCSKSGRVCEGYEKRTIFVNASSSGYANTQYDHGSAMRKAKGLSIIGQEDKLREKGGPPRVQSGSSQRSMDALLRISELHGQSITSPVSILDLQPSYHDQILATFLDYCLPPAAVSEEVPLRWLVSVAGMIKQSKMLPLAASAVGCGWIGRVEQQAEVIGNSQLFYTAALKHLRKALDTPAEVSGIETLATMEMLALYEMLEYGIENISGWSAHMDGIEKLIQLRGPQMHTAGLSQQLFLFYRSIGILRALKLRRATFLGNPDWRHVPWGLHTKNTFHQFLDMAAQVPGLLQRADRLEAGDPDATGAAILDESLDLIAHFLKWEAQTKSSTPSIWYQSGSTFPARPLLPSQLSPHAYPSKSPHSLALPFDVLQVARLILFYYATVLTLFCTLYENPILLQHLAQQPDRIVQSSSLSGQKGERSLQTKLDVRFGTSLADNITYWIDLAAHDAWRSFGPAIAIFSLKAAIKWYDGPYARARSTGSEGLYSLDEPRSRRKEKCIDILAQLRKQTREQI